MSHQQTCRISSAWRSGPQCQSLVILTFWLKFEVKHLLEVETQKTVLIKKKKLVAGRSYLVPAPPPTPPSQSDQAGWLANNQEIVQNALMACQAVYQVCIFDEEKKH